MLALAYAVWIVLNGKITGEILLLGAPIAFLAWVFAKGFLSWNLKKELCFYTMLPLIAAYLLLLIMEIIKASVSVMGYVLTGADPEGVMVEFSSGLRSSFANAVLANSITLTPGTITVTEKRGRFLVCCLSPRYREGIEDICFIKHLRLMEKTYNVMVGEGKK